MKTLILCVAIAFLLSGCLFTRTVYVPHGQAVRLRESRKNTAVWVKTKEGKTLPSKMTIPEGWYCLPLEEKD